MVVTLAPPFNFAYTMAAEPGWVPNNNLVVERGEGFHVNPQGPAPVAFEFESMSTTPARRSCSRPRTTGRGAGCIERIATSQHGRGGHADYEAFLNGEVDMVFVGDQVQAAELDEQGRMAYQVPKGALGYLVANQGFAGGGRPRSTTSGSARRCSWRSTTR